jgi:RimJ/RimL family protein N-acetyltransferase
MSITFLPAAWPVPIPSDLLRGQLVQLEPLQRVHISELTRAGEDARVWQFTTSRGDSPVAMREYVEKLCNASQAGSAMPFAVRELLSDRIVGCTRLKGLDRSHRHGVVGSWYAPEVWRTGVNLEAKLLLLTHAFEKLECVRIEFHTDARNLRSRASLEKLGARFEGVLRAHQLRRDGTLRDSAIYSVLQTEWPTVGSSLRERLRPRQPS